MVGRKDIEDKLLEVKDLMAERRGVFIYWLGFKRALEWVLSGTKYKKKKAKE
tara:strand:+ start:273 stop:428 length:156 start_codon:yes stop_codon:yes gene_type:complete